MSLAPHPSKPRRLILVTGAPRSGTTIAGQCLAASPHASALHEPLNFHVGLRDVDAYFQIIGGGNFSQEDLKQLVSRIRRLELSFKPGVFPKEKGLRRLLKTIIGGRAKNSWRQCRLTPKLQTIIWKDPFACFLSEALATQCDVDVVVTLRNPWAVAASFKRMNWAFDLEDILGRLKSAGLYEGEVPRNITDPVLNAAHLWQAIYGCFASWAPHHQRLHWLSMDDVIAAPAESYKALYDALDLSWAEKAAKLVAQNHTAKGAAMPREGVAHDRNTDYRRANEYWKGLLSDTEKGQVDELCGALWESLRVSSSLHHETLSNKEAS